MGQDEIQGKVQEKAASATEKGESSTTAKTSNAASVPPPETEVASPAKSAAPSASAPVTKSQSHIETKETSTQPKAPAAFMSRTVRVEDPDLVRDLEKGGVKFTGVRPSFMSEFLWALLLGT